MKKGTIVIIVAAICILLVIAFLPIKASAAGNDDFLYEVLNEEEVEIDHYIGSATEVTIPSSIDGYPVTRLFGNVFSGTEVTSISIPDSITNIDAVNAFYDCPDLAEINVSLDNLNFSSDSGVLFNKDKTSLLRYPSAKTDTAYTIPVTIQYIEGRAFDLCTNIQSFSVTSTDYFLTDTYGVLYTTLDGSSVFNLLQYPIGNTRQSFTIPGEVQGIGEDAFKGCTNLISIEVDPSNLFFLSEGGVVYSYDKNYDDETVKTILEVYPAGNTGIDFAIPDTVTSCSNFAFFGAGYIENLDIPANFAIWWNSDALGGCCFETINVDSDNPYLKVQDGVLFDHSMTILYKYPALDTRTSYTIPANCNINQYAFSGSTNLTSITFPQYVTNINPHAFENCTGLDSVTLAYSTYKVSWNAFKNCSNLAYASFTNTPPSVIEQGAFLNCASGFKIRYHSGALTWTTPAMWGIPTQPCGMVTFFDGYNSLLRVLSPLGTTIDAPTPPTKDGYTFAGWCKDYSLQTPWNFSTDKLTANDMALYAKWTSFAQYTITVKTSSATAGTVTGSGSFMTGDTVKVSAMPKNGYRFVRWLESGNTVSTSAEYSFTVTKNRILTAEFAAIGTPALSFGYPSYSKLQLKWPAVAGAAGYEVSRKDPGMTNYTVLTPTTETSLVDTGLICGSNYTYRVRAYCVAGPGYDPTYGTYTTKTASPKWPSITGFTAARGTGYQTAQLAWNQVTDAQGYEVWRSTSSLKGYAFLATVTAGTSYSDETMNGGYTYYYEVRPFAPIGSGTSYGPFSAYKYAKPAWPSITLKSVALDNYHSAVLSWSTIQNIDGYAVFRSTSEHGSYIEVAAVPPETLTYTDETLGGGYTYYYKIKPYLTVEGKEVYGTFSNIKYIKPVWAPITLMSAARESGSYHNAALTWSSSPVAEGYSVFRSTSAKGIFAEIATDLTELSYKDQTMNGGYTYYYKVKPYIMVGTAKVYGSFSNAKYVKPAWPAITLRTPVLHGYHTVDLSWTVVAGADGYSVLRKPYLGTYTEIATDLTGTLYTDELPIGGTVYYYKIKPYVKVGETKVYGNLSNYKYISAKWPAITLSVKTRSYKSLQLDWTNVSGADGYEVQRGTKSSNISTYKDVLTNSLTEEGLAGGTYYYKVRAFNVIGEGELAYRVYSAYCKVKSGKPGWPVITLKVTNNSYNSLKLDWNDLAGITGYNVYRNTRYKEPYTRIAEGIVPSEYIDNKSGTGLSTGATYYYKIEPCDGSVIGPRSAYKSGKPAWPVPSLTVKTDQYESLKLSWTSVNGSDGYDVFRAPSYKGPFTVPVNTETITITEFVNNGLKTGVTYYYKVKPYVMVGENKVYGTASSYKSAKVLPAAPTGLSVSQVPSASIGVSWDPVEGDAKYEVYRATSSAGTFSLVKTTDLNEYIDKTGLVNGKTYYYKVRAYVLVGTSTKVYSIFSAAIPLKFTSHTPYTGPGSWQLVDQTGGTTKALLRVGNTLYIGVGLHVMIFDVTDPKNIKVLGNSPLLPQYVENITCDDEGHLFVCCGSGGLVILDVSRPYSVSILGSLDTRGYTEGVTLDGQYAIIADGPQGVQIADISNLTKPAIVSEAYPLAYAYDAAIKNNIAYVAAGGSGLLVIDLRDPESPQEKGLIELGGFQYDVETAGNKLYTAGAWGGVLALDLSEPLEPQVINTTSTTGWAMALQIQSTSMLVMDGADGAMLYDISGTQPVLKSTYTKGGFIMAGALSGKSAFLLDKEKGLMDVDFSTPSSPQLISRWMPILDGRRVTISGNTGYVASGLSGMHTIDLSDWSHPVDTYWYDTEGGYANKVIVDNKTVYLSTHLDTKYPMVTFNVSNPLKPVKLGAVPNDQAVFNTAFRSMTLDNKHIYIPGEFADASVDVSDPIYPRVVNRISMENPVNAASSGNLLITTNSYQLQLVDISDPSNMRLISTLAKNTSGEAITFINPSTVITAADPGVWIVDVSDPGNPHKEAELAVSGSVMDICIDGSTAYLSTLGNGVQIVDIADPLNPTLKGSVPTLGMAYDCSVKGDLMLVADSFAGLSIYQFGPESGESGESASFVRISLPLLLNEKSESSSLNKKSSSSNSISADSEDEISYIVTNAADSGPGTLRDCLENIEANTTVTFDTTVFDPNSPATIRLETILPNINVNHITIDASNAGVILDGSMMTDGNGLTIYSSDNKIMGLQILNFPQNGIRVEGERNQIGGSRNTGSGPIGQGNLTSGNKLYGIHVYGRDHYIKGNLIGTDVTGTEAMPNYDGLFVSDWAFYVTVGGVNPGEGNVISGNDFINLDTWGDHTRIIGNILGLDITGTKKVQASTSNNLVMESGSMNTIAGGTTPQERNIISGAQLGVVFSDPNSYQNSVIGNYIGTDITGTIDIPNQTGVIIWTTGNHRIGGIADGERNLISGNQNGIQLNGYGVADNIILGNWIGVDSSGNDPLPNDTGISINMGQHHAIIGGYTPEEGNLISGGSISMRISNPGIVDNYIAGNTIRDASVAGVYFEDYSSNNFVQNNIFGSMAGNSVRVDYGSGNEIRGNSFTGNPMNLIYLNENGNLDMPAPVISSADNNSVSGTAGAGCLVEVFVIEGSQVIPLGFAYTDSEGRFTFQSSQPLVGKQIVSLATDAFCNTSVFSSAFTVN